MPVYDYECKSCGLVKKDQLFSSFSSFSGHKCPECGSNIKQTFDYGTVNFKINGYSHMNEYHKESLYRDIGQEKKNKWKDRNNHRAG